MAQVTIRASEELIERVKDAARAAGTSMNEYVNLVLAAATDAELAGTEAERVRERLIRAGLLAARPTTSVSRPDPETLRGAARRAAAGRALSDLVRDGR